jgi:hypothetical protein
MHPPRTLPTVFKFSQQIAAAKASMTAACTLPAATSVSAATTNSACGSVKSKGVVQQRGRCAGHAGFQVITLQADTVCDINDWLLSARRRVPLMAGWNIPMLEKSFNSVIMHQARRGAARTEARPKAHDESS